ncbi:MAG: T9SS type A sorting domain-containing protein [Bacteroidales bacterium]|nr:T9SS type A sorting domain-containing protein [Bacteroidales bacterium]
MKKYTILCVISVIAYGYIILNIKTLSDTSNAFQSTFSVFKYYNNAFNLENNKNQSLSTTHTHYGQKLRSSTHIIYATNTKDVKNTAYMEQSSFAALPDNTDMSTGDYAWLGGTSTEWTTASNWLIYDGTNFITTVITPNSTSNVFLKNNGSQTYSATITSSVACNNLTIEYGTLIISGANELTINGNYTNNATFVKNTSKVIFAGDDATINTGGTSIDEDDFYNLELNTTGIKTVSTNDIRVSNNLTLTAGTIDLGEEHLLNVYGSTITTNGATVTCTIGMTYQFNFKGIDDKTVTGSGGTWNVRFSTGNSNLTINSGCSIFMNNPHSNVYFNGVGKTIQVNGKVSSLTDTGALLYVKNPNNSIASTNTSACLTTIHFNSKPNSQTLDIISDLVISGSIYNRYSNCTLNFNDHNITIGGFLLNQENGTINLGNGTIIIGESLTNGKPEYTDATINAGSGTIYLGRNFTNYGVFNNGGGTIELNGIKSQDISTGGTDEGKTFNNLIINNSSTGIKDINVKMPMLIEGLATFTNGVVYFTESGSLNFGSEASVENNNENSYVNGIVTKSGTTAFTFPIGKGNVWAPIGIDDAEQLSVITAEYKPEPGPLNWAAAHMCSGSELHHTSGVEHWVLTTNNSTPAVTLHWKDGVRSGIEELQKLSVAHYNELTSCWENKNGSPIGEISSGSITSRIPFTSYSPITFGTKTNDNPLPVEYTDFTASYSAGRIILKWTTVTELNNDYFEIERSYNATDWSLVDKVQGAGNSNMKLDYTFIDYNSNQKYLYYRLRQIDYDGSSKLTNTIQVRCDENTTKPLIDLYPNPFSNQLYITTENWDTNSLKIELYDILGQKLSNWSFTDISSNDTRELNISNLPAAFYIIKTWTSYGILVRKVEKK